jgi:hypothetical protein
MYSTYQFVQDDCSSENNAFIPSFPRIRCPRGYRDENSIVLRYIFHRYVKNMQQAFFLYFVQKLPLRGSNETSPATTVVLTDFIKHLHSDD